MVLREFTINHENFSEEESLVINILELSGITINKAGLAQTAANMDQKNIQQEKQ